MQKQKIMATIESKLPLTTPGKFINAKATQITNPHIIFLLIESDAQPYIQGEAVQRGLCFLIGQCAARLNLNVSRL